MPRLIDRQKQVPNGLSFRIPGLKDWSPPRYASINIIATSAITVLKGNPHLAKNLGWDLSESAMIARVDEYNANICKAMGWSEYFVEDSGSGGAANPNPFSPSRQLSRFGNVVAGAKVIVETLASKYEAVRREQAIKRASICAECPMNEKGDWLSFFTVPVSEAIRAAINTFTDWNLQTPLDDKLGTCEACSCPMRLKVHFPIDRIVNGLKDEQKTKLWEKCWIKSEGGF